MAKAKVQSPIDLEIGIYPSDAVVSAMRSFVGKKQVKVDNAALNKRFAVFANDEALLQKWLASSVARQWLTEIKLLDRLEVKNGWVEFQQPGISRDAEELAWMLDLVTGLAQVYEDMMVVDERHIEEVA